MLDRLRVQNYKCLLDVTVELGQFSVLIGPNDSGKTSFLEVIHALGRIAKEPFQKIFTGSRSLDNLVWRKDPSRSIVWDVSGTAAGSPFTYHVELPVGQVPPTESLTLKGKQLLWTEGPTVKVADGAQQFPAQIGSTALLYLLRGVFTGPIPKALADISEALAATVEYRFEIDKLYCPSVPELDPSLHSSGDNLASVLDSLLSGPDRSAFGDLEKALHEAVPSLQGIALLPIKDKKKAKEQGAKAVEFILSGNGQPAVTIPAALASGGALLLTAFLALAYGRTPGFILLEEPENGLHPSRLELVINILRKLSKGEVGNRQRQVIVTTHSPLLLNYAAPEEVRIFTRDSQKGTQVRPLSQVPNIDKLLKEFAIGELWFLLGEEKLVEGKPA